ncbi:hypothetical protein CRUP_034612, partial [Coryphaenoides rupestris]
MIEEEQNRGKPNWEHLNEDLHVLITMGRRWWWRWCLGGARVTCCCVFAPVARGDQPGPAAVSVPALVLPTGIVSVEKKRVFFRAHYNFVGRILGPRGLTTKQLEAETGCKIMVRGKSSMRDKKKVRLNTTTTTTLSLSYVTTTLSLSYVTTTLSLCDISLHHHHHPVPVRHPPTSPPPPCPCATSPYVTTTTLSLWYVSLQQRHGNGSLQSRGAGGWYLGSGTLRGDGAIVLFEVTHQLSML